MLDFFAGRSLPGHDPSSPFATEDTDVGSFSDLWITADLVESCCLIPKKYPGWASSGRHFSLLEHQKASLLFANVD